MITALAGPGSIAGGVWEVVANQTRALQVAGHDVSIVAGWLGSDPPRELAGLDVSLVPLRPAVPGLGLRALVGPRWSTTVAAAIQGSDITHVHLCRDLLTTRAVGIATRMGLPVVAQTHGMLTAPRSALFRAFDLLLTRPAVAGVSHFITLTDEEKSDLAAFGVTDRSATTVANASPEPSRRWEPSTGSHRLLFASRLHPRKQVMVFAETVVRLRRRGHDVDGVIAGPDQGDLAQLNDFIRSGGHDRYLRYQGQLNREALTAELARATAFVFPAREEPFGLVLVEALSVGTPTVSTDRTPLAALLRSHGAAAVCAPEPHLLTDQLDELLNQPELQLSLSRRGRSLYEQEWTTSVMVDRLATVYAATRGTFARAG
jgi:glycosyltransferase involved in cell wall biosynthesis